MLIPKDMVVEQIRARGDFEGAERADRVLGEKVDTERDAGLLDASASTPGSCTASSAARRRRRAEPAPDGARP